MSQQFKLNVADRAQTGRSASRRLRKANLRAKSVWVKIRFGDFKTITRPCTLDEPTCNGAACRTLPLLTCLC